MTDSECDSPEIRAEPPLPPPGTPERDRIDAQQRAICAGLIAAANRRPVP